MPITHSAAAPTGCFGRNRRAIQAAVAAWLEEQSGLSLLTPEGTLPLKRPAGTALAWETMSARDRDQRPGHAITDAKGGNRVTSSLAGLAAGVEAETDRSTCM